MRGIKKKNTTLSIRIDNISTKIKTLSTFLLFNDLGFKKSERLKEINSLIDLYYIEGESQKIVDDFFLQLKHEFLKKENEFLKIGYPHIKHFEDNLMNLTIQEHQFYLSLSNQIEKKRYKLFIKDTLMLFFKLQDILNRVDYVGAAFIFRLYEYDFYVDDMLNKMLNLNSPETIKRYFTKKYKVGKKSLAEKSSWGKFDSWVFTPVESVDEKTKERFQFTFMSNKQKSSLSLNDRLDWGCNQIDKAFQKFKIKHGDYLI